MLINPLMKKSRTYYGGLPETTISTVRSYFFGCRWFVVPLVIIQFLLFMYFQQLYHRSPVFMIVLSDDSSNVSSNIPAIDYLDDSFRVLSPVEEFNELQSNDIDLHDSHVTPVGGGASELCMSPGRVYVYELPEVFNRELAENCSKLNPWNSRCNVVENNGFGPKGNFSGEVVPEDLAGAWFETDQYAGEVIFHHRMLHHPCRTLKPAEATAFYVPFYGGLAVERLLWGSNSRFSQDDGGLFEKLMEWLAEQEWWRRNGGRDHFVVLGRITWDFRRGEVGGWGGRFLNLPDMINTTRLMAESNPWDQTEVSIPWATYFHPRHDGDIDRWRAVVRASRRKALFSFVGGTRPSSPNDFRAELLRQCSAAGDRCMTVGCRAAGQCGKDPSASFRVFLQSEFCLQPRGDSYTRRSMFDCMLAGAIPVTFWHQTTYNQYNWHLQSNASSYSIFIDKGDVKNGTAIESVLAGIEKERITQMRENILEMMPRLVYAYDDGPQKRLKNYKDAFEIAVDGVIRRINDR